MNNAVKINQHVRHITLHLSENDLLPLRRNCSFCGKTDLKSLLPLQKNPDVFFLECIHCKAVSASRMPKPETLSLYYENYYTGRSVSAPHHVTFQQTERMAAHWFRYFKAYVKNGAATIRILDYGGGDGALAAAFGQKIIQHFPGRKIEILVIDFAGKTFPAPAGITISTEQPGYVFEKSAFDFVMASAIIEHVPEGGELLRQLFESIKPGGCFYARSPWAIPVSRISKRLGRKWNFFFPAHVHDLGKHFWEFHAAGFDVIASRPSLVQSSFRKKFRRTLIAFLAKAPWFLFRSYEYVGGWEIFLLKKSS